MKTLKTTLLTALLVLAITPVCPWAQVITPPSAQLPVISQQVQISSNGLSGVTQAREWNGHYVLISGTTNPLCSH